MSKYRCGKCGSGGLYRDDDYATGRVYIACTICGNRWPGGAKPVDGNNESGSGNSGDMMLHRVPTENKEGSEMAITRACRNCRRELTIIADGCCYVCYHAGKGLLGEEKAAALLAVKVKIDSGKMRKGGGRRGPRKPAQEIAPAPAGGRIKKKVEERASKEQKSGAIVPGSQLDIGPIVEGETKKLSPEAIKRLKEGVKARLIEKRAAANVPGEVAAVYLKFSTERDRAIYDAIHKAALHERRTPEDHVLWLLEWALLESNDLQETKA